MHNKGNLVANQNGRQPKTLGEIDVTEDYLSDGDVLVISDEDWVFVFSLYFSYLFQSMFVFNIWNSFERCRDQENNAPRRIAGIGKVVF